MKVTVECKLSLDNKVRYMTWSSEDGDDICIANLNPDGQTYQYSSRLGDDEYPTIAPIAMSLADCTLNAHVHLGLIPPQQFVPIPCENQY